MVAVDIKNSSCTCGIGNELSFFREKTGVLPDSVNFLSFIDNLHETGPSEPGGALPPTIWADTLTLFESGWAYCAYHITTAPPHF